MAKNTLGVIDMRPSLSALAKNTLLLLFSILFSFVIAEVLSRYILPDDSIVEATPDQYKFYRFDSRLGWKNASNRSGEFRRAEFSYPVRINGQGMRYKNVTLSPPSNGVRLAVLGDSFVWGIGVSDEDRFTNLVESMSEGKYELLNFGVSGYSPVQYLLQLDQVLKFQPQLVIISFCLGNDFADNVFWRRYGYYKPFVGDIDGSDFEISGYPLPNVREFSDESTSIAESFLEHSWIFRYAKKLYRGNASVAKTDDLEQRGLLYFDESQKDLYFPEIASDPTRRSVEKAILINRALLLSIRDHLSARGTRFAVVIAPTKCEFGGCFPESSNLNTAAYDSLTSTLNELDIDVIDPTPDMTIGDFWAVDGHWRPSGHLKVAKHLIDYLSSKSFTENSIQEKNILNVSNRVVE